MNSLLPTLDPLAWSELFGQSLASSLHVKQTNPHNSDISTLDTITLMDSHVLADVEHPAIQDAIDDIERNSKSDSREDLIEATFEYVKEKVTFVEDETILARLFNIDSGTELLITPARLLTMHTPMGDCDDFSSLTKCLLMGMGIDTDFTTVAADSDNPGKFSHVYVEDEETGIPIDTSHGKYLGWEAPNITRKQIWKRRRRNNNNMITGMGAAGDFGGEISGQPADTVSVPSWSSNDPIASVGSGINWSSLLAPLTTAGSKIAVAQFGQPQLAPGTFIRGADGSILTNQPVTGGGVSNLFSGSGSGLSGGTLLLVAAGLGLLLMMKK